MGNKIAYTAGHIELTIDGAKTSAYLKSLDGGFMGHWVVDESIGGEKLTPLGGAKQKMWLCSAFRFNIDGIDDHGTHRDIVPVPGTRCADACLRRVREPSSALRRSLRDTDPGRTPP